MQLQGSKTARYDHVRGRQRAVLAVCQARSDRAHSLSAVGGAAGPAAASDAASANVSSLPLPPGPPLFMPMVGDMPDIQAKGTLAFGVDRYLQYGRICKAHVLGEEGVMIMRAEDIVRLMQDDMRTTAFSATESFRRLQTPRAAKDASASFSVNVMTQAEMRLTNRRIMMKGLSGDALHSYIPFMNEAVRSHVSKWADAGGLELRQDLRTLTMDFANGLLVGMELSDEEKIQAHTLLNDYFLGMFCIPVEHPGSTFSKALEARDQLANLMLPHVQAQRERLLREQDIQGKGGRVISRKSVLGYMMEARAELGYEITDEVLAQGAMGMLQAGVDTSGATFTNLLFAMSHLPEVYQRLREEQDRIVAKHGPEITKEAMDDMVVAEAIIKETLYWSAPGAFNFRRALQDMELCGHLVKKGQLISLHYYAAHAIQLCERKGIPVSEFPLPARLPNFNGRQPDAADLSWVEQVWDIDRWLCKTPPTLLSFHTGPHTCAGMALFYMEARALVAAVVRDYDLAFTGDLQQLAFDQFPLNVPTVSNLYASLTPRQA